ncbi:hypothetical protein GQ44DRAFT_826523 [Phaeosphaeriaceae sp. PMI808]|nr:hypothetical protein GQ44DRAFT_826523 [Phaeosphaeriaceae sp. PMI808]
MRNITFCILSAFFLQSTTTATLSDSSVYKLKIKSGNERLKDRTLVLKDESTAAAILNPLGSFSPASQPRNPYNFNLVAVSEADKLYELQGVVKKTHLIINGDPRATQFFDAPIGGDPIPLQNKTITRTKFTLLEKLGHTFLISAENVRGGDGDFVGPGSWRACTNNKADYQLYWYDGQSQLDTIIPGCESIELFLEKGESSASSTLAPSPTSTSHGFITEVPAPSRNSTATGSYPTATIFPGSAAKFQLLNRHIAFIVGAAAFLL